MSDKTTRVLLALREGVRSWPYKVRGILSDIPRQTVEYQIKKLEEDGTIQGYIPIVKPEAFGQAYLVRFSINPADYRMKDDVSAKIEKLRQFISEAVDHAPVSFFVFQDEQKRMIVNLITISENFDSFIDRLCIAHNVSKEDLYFVRLDVIEGIPNYSKHSLLQEGQMIES